MTDNEIWHCPETTGNEYVVSNSKPADDEEAEKLLTADDRNQLSRFMSWALRHDPDEAGICLDPHGWTDAYELTEVASESYDWVTPRHIAAIVSTDPKGRYEVSGNKIRAVYGHSDHLNVTIIDDDDTETLPNVLYHGTGSDNVATINRDGLQPMSRQHVHLTDSVDTAVETGNRHSDSVTVFAVDVEAFTSDGYDVEKRGEDVYVAPQIPPKYLKKQDYST